jgi:hypothetical protein
LEGKLDDLETTTERMIRTADVQNKDCRKNTIDITHLADVRILQTEDTNPIQYLISVQEPRVRWKLSLELDALPMFSAGQSITPITCRALFLTGEAKATRLLPTVDRQTHYTRNGQQCQDSPDTDSVR